MTGGRRVGQGPVDDLEPIADIDPMQSGACLSTDAVPSGSPWVFERGDQVELGERLLARLLDEGRTLVVGDEGSLFAYRPACGLWTEVTSEEQSKIVQTFAGATVRGRRDPLRISAFDVRGAVKLAYDQVAKPGYFSAAPAGFAFANGFVSVDAAGIKLAGHSPDHRARLGFAFPYARNSPAPMFLGLLDDLFRDDADKKEKIAAVQDHAGASLVGVATDYQSCILWVGPDDEGKARLAKILSECFPPGTVEAVPPHEFDQEYRRAMMVGKLLNLVTELPPRDLASEAFKAILAGQPITGRPIRQAPIMYKSRAGHLLLANQLPVASDQPQGYWGRFILIRFNRCLTGDAVRDPKIADRILAAEHPGIVPWMLEGAARVMAQNRCTLPASHHVELAEWRRNPDPIAAFVRERTSHAPEGRGARAKVLYQSYRTWAEQHRLKPVSSTRFGIRLRELRRASKKTRVGKVYPLAVIVGEETVGAGSFSGGADASPRPTAPAS
jgi:P4 family phage/plasmid primase-like protien